MSKSYGLDERLRVISPCNEIWEMMEGNDKIRFCSHCQKTVNNISSLTREEAIDLAYKSKGNLCVKYYRKSDGTIRFITTNPNFNQNDENKNNNDSLVKFAAGLFFAAALTSVTPVMAQTRDISDPVRILSEYRQSSQQSPVFDGSSSISGTILDTKGALVAGVNITLTSKTTGATFSTTSNEFGNFSFSSIPEDDYVLVTETPGFKKTETDLSSLTDPKIQIALNVSDEQETVTVGGVMAFSPGEEMISYYEERTNLRENGEKRNELSDDIKEIFDAISNNDIKKVKAKLKKTNHLSLFDEEGETLLSYAIGNEKILKLLLKARADVNITNKFFTTALMYASVRDNTKIANLLINYGANVNAVDINGRSPLIFASADNNLEMLKLLLMFGANINIQDSFGKTALSYAKEYKHEEIENLLKSIGAK